MKQKKYAFVSDYVRAYALYHEGGIYLDTDVEIKRNLDVFLNHQSFSGRECSGVAFTSAVWGAEPHHSLTKKVLAFYDNRKYVEELEAPNTSSISKILAKDYGIDLDTNKLEVGLYKQDSIHIYPAEYFCLDRMPNYTTHHFYGSWLDEDIDYKSVVDFEANFFRGLENYSAAPSKAKLKIMLKRLAKILTFKDICNLIRYCISSKFKTKL